MRILALERDEKKAIECFVTPEQKNGFLLLITGTVEELLGDYVSIDYQIHGASQTANMAFIEKLAETKRPAVRETENVLELTRNKQVKGFVYLSSMGIYFYPPKWHKVTENEIGALTLLTLQ